MLYNVMLCLDQFDTLNFVNIVIIEDKELRKRNMPLNNSFREPQTYILQIYDINL
jgi:hypothetical protein